MMCLLIVITCPVSERINSLPKWRLCLHNFFTYDVATGHPQYRGEVFDTVGNPRYSNGTLRRKHRARFKAMAAPCGICGGRLGPIHYDEPSDAAHPLSFVIDEVHPVSKWKQFGYDSPQECAKDWNNLQAAHYCCNQAKGNKVGFRKMAATSVISGEW